MTRHVAVWGGAAGGWPAVRSDVTTYRVRVGLRIIPDHAEDDLDAFTDDMMAQLECLDADADLGGSVASGAFQAWVTVEAATPLEAVMNGSVTIRTAAHAAGGRTDVWPQPEDWPDWIQTVSIEAEPFDVPEPSKEPACA